jgi:tetratricopeptide (TPR) repeat protein
MSHLSRPKIFNDENVFEAAEAAGRDKSDEVRSMMLRAEKLSRWTRVLVICVLWGVLIKDAVPFSLFGGLTAAGDLKAVFNIFKNIVFSAAGVIFSNKLYYFFIIVILWFVTSRPSIFLYIFAENFSALYKKGLKQMQKEKYDLAAETFIRALKSFMPPSDQIRIRSALCECLFKESLYEDCAKNGFEILELDGANDTAQTYIAKSFLQLGERGDIAVKFYIYLFNKEVYDKKLLNILITYFLSANDLSEIAVRVYKKVYEVSPDNPAVREMVYKSCTIVNDRSSYALKLYEEMLDEEPSRKDIKLALVSAYYESKDYRRTAEMARSLFEQNEFSKKLLELYDESMTKSGLEAIIYDEFQTFMSKFPDNRILADYFNSKKSLFMAGRLMRQSAAQAQTQAQGRPAGAESGGAVKTGNRINICANCAHMNPAGISHCEKCRSALTAL